MKKRVFLLGLLFLVGLSVLLYPLISSEWNRHRSDAMIDSYTQTVSQAPAEDRSAWIDSARQYNAALEGKHFPDAFANITREESAAYLAQLAFDDNGVMAYISGGAGKGRGTSGGLGAAGRRRGDALRHLGPSGTALRYSVYRPGSAAAGGITSTSMCWIRCWPIRWIKFWWWIRTRWRP